MKKNKIVLGVLGVLLAVTLSSKSLARVCALRSTSGTCLFWKTGSVEAEFNVDRVNLKNKPTAGIVVTPLSPPPDSTEPAAVIICGAPGNGNASPGAQLVFLENPVVESFSNTIPLTANDKINGNQYHAKVKATPLDPFGPDYAAILADLSIHCPNENWTASAYVPCFFRGQARQSENNQLEDQKTQDCALPDCSTLGFSQVSPQSPPHFDARQYTCVDVPE